MDHFDRLEMITALCGSMLALFVAMAIGVFIADFIVEPLLQRHTEKKQRLSVGRLDPINGKDADTLSGRSTDKHFDR